MNIIYLHSHDTGRYSQPVRAIGMEQWHRDDPKRRAKTGIGFQYLRLDHQ